MKKKPAKITLG